MNKTTKYNSPTPILSQALPPPNCRSAKRRSILLLEDVDAAFTHRTAGKVSKKLTFSGLLNALDGVAAQEGRIIFLTTNHIDRLSKALIRPGRVDYTLQFTYATVAQMRGLFLSFYGVLEGPPSV